MLHTRHSRLSRWGWLHADRVYGGGWWGVKRRLWESKRLRRSDTLIQLRRPRAGRQGAEGGRLTYLFAWFGSTRASANRADTHAS